MMSRFPIALILLAASGTLCSAQSLDDHDYKLTVNVQLVQLPVSVLDKKGFPVRDLQREHFVVYEDRVLQEISFVKQENVPLSLGLLVDTSGSMLLKLDGLYTAAMTFVRQSNPGDETSIVSFADSVNLDQDFTSNTGELSLALRRIIPYGRTSLYDAVVLAAQHLTKDGFRDKKVLLIISDGKDNHSNYQLKEVLDTLRESEIIAYSVGLLRPDISTTYRGFGESGRRTLKQLAEVTGGTAFFPESAGDVEAVCERIVRDLRNQYTIGYQPSNQKMDGSWRKTVVQVSLPNSSPKVLVRTKQGYYAPGAKEVRGESRPTLK